MDRGEQDVSFWKKMLKFRALDDAVFTSAALNYSLTKRDMLRLLDPNIQLLTDSHMSAATQVMRSVADRNGVLLLDSFFYPLFCTKDDPLVIQQKLGRFTHRLAQHKIVCFPVHLPGHWVVCVADLDNKTICVVDSLEDPSRMHNTALAGDHWTIMQNTDRVLSIWMALNRRRSHGPFFYGKMAHGRVQPGNLCGFYAIMYLVVQAHTPYIWRSNVSLDESHDCGLFLANLFTGMEYDWNSILFSDFSPEQLKVYRLPLRVTFGLEHVNNRHHMYFTDADIDPKVARSWPSFGPVPDYLPLARTEPWVAPRRTLEQCVTLTERMTAQCVATGGYSTLNLIVDASSPLSFAASRNFFCEMLRMCFVHVGEKRYDLCVRLVLLDDYCAKHLRKLFKYYGGWFSNVFHLTCSLPASPLLTTTLTRLSNNACFYASCADSFRFHEWEIAILHSSAQLQLPSHEHKLVCG